ncbi:hypothetical protein CFC21_098614 [Triticum aestivum]|uniref:FAD-binding PCMH-type domain-containing protein n=2 Tax=Triticum aestivum TaxID=4565 RepID=A0A9R1LX66_WHEAT|nr:hypothetical protein CFC21_098614 [Triticum aestivum]
MALSGSLALALLFSLLSCYASVPSLASSDGFIQCLSAAIPRQLLYTQSSPSFTSVLVSSIRNPKFSTPGTVRLLCIVTPTNASHVQAAVVCGRRNDVRIRVRSGGHDYEGLSYRSARPEVFAVVDLANLRSVRVDQKAATAWVDSGATLGGLYYAVSKASSQLAFPAGLCPTIGVGGHFSGGGFGMLLRKYGVAIDNVLDATLVDANGRILDKQAMGADVFWAIRGGGGESFGIVLSWQKQAANFESMYLGTPDTLLPLMRSRFPELGLNRTHCKEMTWIQSAIPKDVWVKIFAWLGKPDAGLMIMDPYGGKIGSPPESATPFPHRGGVLYNIQYMNFWSAATDGSAQTRWLKDLYAFMGPYVSKNPREAYANYRDLDLGQNVVVGNVTSYEAGKVWGEKYYKGNFQRLATAKSKVDPDDYFRNEQSIPPLPATK